MRNRRSWWRFAGIVALFAALGPLLGVVVAAPIGLGDVTDMARYARTDPLIALLFVVTVAVVVAYAVGWLQGLLIGIVMAMWYRRTGDIPILLAALCGIASLAVPLGLGLPDFGGKEPARIESPAEYAFLLAAHVLPAIACAALARRRFAPVRSSGGI